MLILCQNLHLVIILLLYDLIPLTQIALAFLTQRWAAQLVLMNAGMSIEMKSNNKHTCKHVTKVI